MTDLEQLQIKGQELRDYYLGLLREQNHLRERITNTYHAYATLLDQIDQLRKQEILSKETPQTPQDTATPENK